MSNWNRVTLGQLQDQGDIHIQTGPFGSQLHASDYETVGIPVVTTESIARGGLQGEVMPLVSTATATRLARHKLKTGDIVFARRGAQATGLSALVTSEFSGSLCGTGALLMRIQSDNLDPHFVSFALGADSTVDWLKAHAVGAVMPNLNETVLRGLPLLLPPVAEQREIADILGSLDDKIALNRRLNATLEALARALFKSWFVDFDPVRAKAAGRQPAGMDEETAALFPDGFDETEMGEVPRGWRYGQLADLAKITMGQSPPSDTYNETGDGLPFYQGTRDFGFRFPSRRVYCTAPTRFAAAGDALLSVRAPVGDLNVATEKCAIGRGVASLASGHGTPSYLYHALRASQSGWQKFEAEGTVFGSVSKTDVHNFGMCVPPEIVMQRFESLVAPLDRRVSANEKESQTLTEMRDALLPRLMSGETRVENQQSAKGVSNGN